jgi:hypothetical protein
MAVLAAVKDAARAWPEDGPSLTAAARAGTSSVQAGRKDGADRTKGWDRRRQSHQTGPKSPTRFHEEAKFKWRSPGAIALSVPASIAEISYKDKLT